MLIFLFDELFFEQFLNICLNNCIFCPWTIIVLDLAITISEKLVVVFVDTTGTAILMNEEGGISF